MPEFVTRHPGITLVLVGVLGEGFEIVIKLCFKHRSPKFDRIVEMIGAIFWVVLVVGLAWEFREAGKTDLQIEQLRKDNATLRIRFAEAEAKLRESEDARANLLLVASNAVLVSHSAASVVSNANVAVLENLSRRLSNDDKFVLFHRVSPLPKRKIAFFIDQTVPDAERLSDDLYSVFRAAGWQLGSVRGGISLGLGRGVFVSGDESDGEAIRTIADALTFLGLGGHAATNEIRSGLASTNEVLITIGYKPHQ